MSNTSDFTQSDKSIFRRPHECRQSAQPISTSNHDGFRLTSCDEAHLLTKPGRGRRNRARPSHTYTPESGFAQEGTYLFTAGNGHSWLVNAHFHPAVSEKRRGIPCRVYFSPELYPDFPKCTLTWREVGPFHRLFSPHESLSAPSKGHQNPNLPALNKQWQPALLVYAGGPLLPKITKTSTLPLLNIQYNFFTCETDKMGGGRERDQRTHKPKYFHSKKAMATSIACLGPLLPKNTKTSTLPLLNIQCHFFTAWNGQDGWRQREGPNAASSDVCIFNTFRATHFT